MAQVEDFVPDRCQLQCLARLAELESDLIGGKQNRNAAASPRGLYVYGGVGTGKTMMLDLFHQEISAAGVSCDRQHFHEFLQGVHTRLHKLRMLHGSHRGLLQRCAEEYREEFPVLAFDEAHVLNVGDALMLRTFFEAFFNAGGVMVATSNVAPNDLYSSGINRNDYRARATQSGKLRGLYLWRESDIPSGPPSPLQFFGLRRALGLPETLPLQSEAVDIDVGFGRHLCCATSWEVSFACERTTAWLTRRIVHFTFDDLCRTMTGASEWVGIAEFADAIILTGVPRFEVHDEDAARRFVTFVDIVYDKQRFLVITADSSPQEVFSNLVEKYGGDVESMMPSSTYADTEDPTETPGMKMPAHGLGSGRHGVMFQRPKQLQYGVHGDYVQKESEGSGDSAPVPHATSVTQTGGRAEHGSGSQERVMQGEVKEDSDWVEWSATGLKNASLFDLSPVNTSKQVNDKLLPFRRCASRLQQMKLAE